jgi:Na+-translocating ferredoxin:NAD+ oxidoreductase RnfD subunit
VAFFRTPKGLLLIVLAILVAAALPAEDLRRVGPNLAAAVAAAMLLDAPILRWRGGAWELPSGALLTGLIVAMVLSPTAPWYAAAVASAVGVLAKYVVRTRSANVFNPAALGIVVVHYGFGAGQSWWGALGDVTPLAVALLVATGVFITDRVNKLPLVLAFLGEYFLIFTAAAFLRDPARVAEIFRPPDVQAVLFFAFFILTDPPTSPVRYGEQMIAAPIVAVSSAAVFEGLGAAHYLLAGVLVGNVWEAWRRARRAALS